MPRARFLRFGLLTLFAAMLILISAAGWARSELDLYREEQAIVAELTKAGCTVGAFRGELNFETTLRRNQVGFAWYEPEWLTRMSSLDVFGSSPEELRRRAVALPTLQSLRIFAVDPRSPRTASDPRPQAFPPSSELLGRPLPEFGELTIDEGRLNVPLPDGETISGADREALLAEIRTAWSSESPRLPPKYVKRIERDERRYSPARIDLVRDGDRYWSVQPHFPSSDVEESLLTLRNDEAEYGLEYRDSAWRLARRGEKGIDPGWAQRMALLFSGSDLPRFDLPHSFPVAAILDHVERVARIDEDRVRLDVKPAIIEASPTLAPGTSFDVEQMTLILREDMDWAVGSERSMVTPLYSGTRGSAQEIVYERALERRQGFVVPTEEVLGTRDKGPQAYMITENGEIVWIRENGEIIPIKEIEAAGVFAPMRKRYAWELNPDLDPAIFDPNRYLAEPLLPRTRPFPWWLVTLATGGGIVVFLIARKAWLLLRRRRLASKVEPSIADG